MKFRTLTRFALLALVLFFGCQAAGAIQLGTTDYTKAETKAVPVRANISVIQIKTPQDLNNIIVLAGPDGYLLVDHPEGVANPFVQKALDSLGKKPVRFLLNTHWHYDHVGGNEIYGPQAVIVAHENVRKRLMTAQKPFWSPVAIGPYPERAWPTITFRDSLTIHFAGEDVEMDHYANGHTDSDSVVYFANANVAVLGDIYDGKGSLDSGADVEGIAKSLAAVLAHTNNHTILITGHNDEFSNRVDLAMYLPLLNQTLDFVRSEIAAGKSEKEVSDAGLPAFWAPWFAPQKLPAAPDFMARIYKTLAHTNPIDQ
jgi:glyoxylase-like metal-dependent hydrolase (beta-lactamase superfamily II)